MTDGTCLEDLKKKRCDEAYLNALGTQRIPDASTAGDFCRRFKTHDDINRQHAAIDEARRNVWALQPDKFFAQATVDMDGSIVETTGECKVGMDMSYKGIWGRHRRFECGDAAHPLLISLAETREPLRIVNRSVNQTSEDGAAFECDGVADYLQDCGFRKIVFRGDTAYSQTEHLDRWDDRGITFYFGCKVFANLEERAENLDDSAWTTRQRPSRHSVDTQSTLSQNEDSRKAGPRQRADRGGSRIHESGSEKRRRCRVLLSANRLQPVVPHDRDSQTH